ncbi:MAG: alpha/beta hydrolase [Clostridiales bacterium]|nr:alpha/beta hydrolase [Clostridiales bacterium]
MDKIFDLVDFISEENLEKDIKTKVEPYLESNKESGFFTGQDDISIFYKKFEVKNSIASLVIVHGLSQETSKYNEFIYYFLKSGISVYIYDQRCHGKSDRLTDNPQMIHVNSFQDYILDLKKFLNDIVLDNSKNIFIYGHSMGGSVVAKFIEKFNNIDKIKLAILSQPMLGMKSNKCGQKQFDRYIENPEIINNSKNKYCDGQGNFNYLACKNNSEYKKYPRYRFYLDNRLKNPEIITGGSSIGWFDEAFKAVNYVMKDKNLYKIKIPVFIFQSENDRLVSNEAQDEFAKKVKSCEIIKLKNSEHTTISSDDETFKNYLKHLLKIFENYFLKTKENKII